MDGLAQRFPFQTDAIDGQDSVPYVDGPGPAEWGGGAEVQDHTRQVASLLTQTQTMRLLVTEDGDTVVVCLKLENKELHRDDGVRRCRLSI